MKLLLLITFVGIAMAGEAEYPVPALYPTQQNWPTLYGNNFASTCWGCRGKRSAEAEPQADVYQVSLVHHALSGNTLIPKAEAQVAPEVVPAAPAVVPTYIHGVHTAASALDLKNSVPVPVGAPAPTYGNVPVVPVPAAPVVPALPVPTHPVYPAVPALPAYPVLPVAPVAPVVPVAPVAPVAPAAPVEPVAPVVAPLKLGAAVHPEGILNHVERSPQGLSDFTRLNLYNSHIPVLSALPAEVPAVEERRKRSAEPSDFYENFYALHGEYPKAFVAGPGIYGTGHTGISTVFDVRSSPFGQIG